MAGPWYAHFPADYERKTSHLTMLEDGAYRRMLDHYYATGIALPLNSDHLYRICRAFSDEERSAIDSILKQYFIKKRDGYHNKRADEEIAEAERRKKIKAEAGRSGGMAARGKSGRKPNSKPIADELQKNTPSPSPSHSAYAEKILSPTSRPKAARSKNVLNGHQREFDEFWSVYPRRVAKGKAVKAYAKALSKTDDATILSAAKRYAELRKSEDPQYTAYPASWLNGECWTDDFTERIDVPDPKLAEALEAERRHREQFGEIE